MRIIASSGYPWENDPPITNAWVGDRKYLDSSGSVGLWSPNKGTIPLVQATAGNKPTYSAAYGSQNKGAVTGDGVDDWMSGDALAAKVTGNNPWTIIASFNLVSVVAFADVLGFGNTSDTKAFHLLHPFNDTNKDWRVVSADDGTISSAGLSTFPADTSRIVMTTSFIPSSTNDYTMRINGNPQTVTRTTTPTPSFGTISLSKFTVFAFRGATTIRFCAARLRTLLFSPSFLLPASYRTHEKFLIAEAA